MGQVQSGFYPLRNPNAVRLIVSWTEQLSGNKNTVNFSMTVYSKYRISGTWKCSFIADGTDFGAPRVRISHGGKTTPGSTVVRSNMVKTFTYSGSKSISITAALPDMDYYDVDEGSGSSQIYRPSFTTTINLKNNNSAPPTPSISCNNSKVGSNYLAEGTLDITLSSVKDPDGDTVRYVIYGERKEPGKTYWEKIGDGNSCLLWSTTARSVSHKITQYPRGTQFRVWGHAEDGKTKSGTTSTISNIWRNKIPNPVNEILPKEGYFNSDSFTINWDKPSDPDGNIPTINLWLSKDGADYVKVLSNSSATSYTQNIANDAEGTQYKFKIYSYDGLVESAVTTSSTYVKNTKPTKPTQIFPNEGFALGSTLISWNKSTDPEGRGIDHYIVYINDIKVGTSKTTSYTWIMPDSDPSEKEYTVSIEAVDVDGKSSDRGYATGSFKKAKPPAAPAWIKPQDTYFENNIPLTWENISSNGVSVTYELSYRINGGQWIVLTNTLRSPQYTHSITEITRGNSIEYRIKCSNTFGQSSPYAYSKVYYRNRIPLAPTISYPLKNSKVHDSTPRIAFTIHKELDSQKQTIYVKCGGKVYNSITHASMFSKKAGSYSTEEKVVFTCDELSNGSQTIVIYVNDGLINSPESSRTFAVENSTLNALKSDRITAELFNTMRTQINTIRKAYGLSEYVYDTKITIGALIRFKYIEEMRSAILDVRNVINDYDSSNPDKLNTTWENSGKDKLINASIVQQIIDIIKNT
jgi:hypothetical protein